MTAGECDQYTQLRCEANCGNESLGQQCTSENQALCTQILNLDDEENAAMLSIDLNVESFYNSHQAQCDAATGATEFATEAQCETYCGLVCLEFCPDDITGCGTACVSSLCANGGWQTHTDVSNFAIFRDSWITPNATCGEPATTEDTATGFDIDQGSVVNRNVSVENPLGETTDPRDVIATVVRAILIFLGVITLIIFIISGIMMMTSGGNEERFKKARNAMIYAIIGLAIVLASYSILEFVFNRLLTATGA